MRWMLFSYRLLVSRKRTMTVVFGLVLSAVGVLAWYGTRPTAKAIAQDTAPPNPKHMDRLKNYSPYVDRSHPQHVY